jgi:site-specific DNA-methyltransferase (cytosine-N4-specific)
MARSSNKPNLRLVHTLPDQKRPSTRANEAMHPKVMSEAAFASKRLTDAAYYSDPTTLILHMDVREGLRLLIEEGVEVNCIVTSPPFYGQRDYDVGRQIGLGVSSFRVYLCSCRRVQ